MNAAWNGWQHAPIESWAGHTKNATCNRFADDVTQLKGGAHQFSSSTCMLGIGLPNWAREHRCRPASVANSRQPGARSRAPRATAEGQQHRHPELHPPSRGAQVPAGEAPSARDGDHFRIGTMGGGWLCGDRCIDTEGHGRKLPRERQIEAA